MTDQQQRVAPQNVEAEEHVLGAMLLSAAAIDTVSETLEPGDFYRESHGTIYRCALTLHVNGEPVDAITVIDELEKRGDLERVGGRAKVHELANIVPATANAGHYATIVREMAQLRGLIGAGQTIEKLGYDRPGETRDLIDRAENIIFNLAAHRDAADLLPLRASLPDTYRSIISMDDDQLVTGTPTGFQDLDIVTTGFQPGQLIILAARPSMGKTSLALSIATHVGLEAGLPVALFSLEMSRREVDQRLLAIRSQVKLQRLRTGKLNDAFSHTALLEAAGELEDAPIYVDDTADSRAMEIRSKVRRLKARHGLGLVIVDYLQLMGSETRTQNRNDEVAQISRALKVLSRDLEVPVLCLSQLSRDAERRPDKRPVLPDLRDSGAIEQDADIVMFVHREGYYERQKDASKPDDEAELIIRKHRNGRLDTIHLAWDGPTATFKPQRAGLVPR